MPHHYRGQKLRQYKPSATRRNSKLSPVNETREKAIARWNKLRQAVKRQTAARKAARRTIVAHRNKPLTAGTYGRFTVLNLSPKKPKGATAGTYGRFKVMNLSPNAKTKYQSLQSKIIALEEKILKMKRNFAKVIDPLEDQLEEYYTRSRSLKKKF